MRYQVTVGDRRLDVDVDGARVTVDGVECHAELRSLPGTPLRQLVLDARSFVFLMERGERGAWVLEAAGDRFDVLVLDDWGLAALDGPTRSDLMEVIDDRAGTRSTIVTSQLPVEHWHAWIGDATVADAILDRLLSRSHRLELKGASLRPRKADSAPTADGEPIKPSAATGKSR